MVLNGIHFVKGERSDSFDGGGSNSCLFPLDTFVVRRLFLKDSPVPSDLLPSGFPL